MVDVEYNDGSVFCRLICSSLGVDSYGGGNGSDATDRRAVLPIAMETFSASKKKKIESKLQTMNFITF